MKTVAIVGGGASGLMAALSAAENPENRVLLFERQARIGRKLMATGNGRCNLTNTGASPENYHGEQPEFVLPAMEQFPPNRVLQYFRTLGLVCTEQYGGRVYPLSDAAGSVLDVLRFALERAGADMHTGEPVQRMAVRGSRKLLYTENGEYCADAVIIACGGRAGGKLGGVSDGYELLQSVGHHCTKTYPVLVPLRTDTDYPRSLKGIRADARVTLVSGKETRAESCGEVQFTEKGVSGPAVFDVSRAASTEGGTLKLDFLRDLELHEVQQLLAQRRALSPDLENGNLFAGILHSRLGMAVVKYAGLRPSERIGDRTDGELHSAAAAAKNFTLNVTGTDGMESAQVTAGGIRTREFNSRTMESRLVPGVYACGEVLDIDGDCGGYNLQWAWASGRLAGRTKT